LEAEALNVGLIDRMLTRGLEADNTPATPASTTGQLPIPSPGLPGAEDPATSKVVPAAGRFVRDAGEFATGTREGHQLRRPS
jgi:hypothetical protein